MNSNTKQLIQQVLSRVISTPIPIRWRSSQVMAGGGDRRSFSKGSNGYDIQARVEYEPGDDPRDIDWAATAQTGGQSMYITQYMEPRDLKVFVLVDVNPSMDFGTHRTSKRILSAELAGSIVKSAQETHDQVGYITYGKDRIVSSRRPMSASRALFPVIASTIEDEGTARGEDQSSGLLKALGSLPRKRSLVYLLSDFLSLTDDEKRALKRASVLHDVVLVVVQDKRERELPDGWGLYTLADLSTGARRSVWLSRRTRAQFAERSQSRQAELIAFIESIHCQYAVFSTEEGREALNKVMRLFGGHKK